jgi:hypothetical protein
MKRKLLTETHVCPQERLVIISYTTGLSFALERIGPLAAITIIVFYLLVLYLLHYQIPLKTCLLVFTVNPWSKPLVNTFCSSFGLTLLFIKSTTIHPLYLWVITHHRFFVYSQLLLSNNISSSNLAIWLRPTWLNRNFDAVTTTHCRCVSHECSCRF